MEYHRLLLRFTYPEGYASLKEQINGYLRTHDYSMDEQVFLNASYVKTGRVSITLAGICKVIDIVTEIWTLCKKAKAEYPNFVYEQVEIKMYISRNTQTAFFIENA